VLFGGGALLLAMVGIYGVVAYLVAQRTKEIGVRMALGARRHVVLRFVVGDALRLLGHGLVVGIPVALVAASSLRSLLFGVAPQDALTISLVCVVLIMTTITAAVVPAFRAARVDPVVALRAE
jgi:putative ABC transport system permease protein